MSRKMLWVLLVAAMPAVVCAQEKVTNCRTLEEAGNFVGPDEVIMNDLVCTKVKPGPQAVQPIAPKPLPGAVISNGDATNVVEAAKAASKRVAAAKDAIKEKAEQTEEETSPESVPPAAPDTDSVAPATPAETPKTPPTVVPPVPPAPPAVKPPIQFPVKPPASELAAAPPAPSTPPSSEPAAAATVKPMESQAAPVEVAPAASAIEPAVSEPTTSLQPVAAPEPAVAKSEASETVAAPSAETAPAVSEDAKAAEPPAAEKGTGFYDANAGANVVVNPQPEDTAKPAFAAPEAANPPAEAAEPANVAPKTLTPAEAEAQAALLAPDPNLPRERVVATGSFTKPREEGPDPEAAEHKTTFLPGDTEGFEEGQRAECTKNITLGGLNGEKLVLGTPEWAAKWIEKNQKHMPQMCFSDTPMKKARNYLVVFYTVPAATNGNEVVNASLTPKGTPAAGVGAFTLSYGSTWHYAVDRTVGVTVLTRDEGDEPYSKPGQLRYATAYTEEGVPVAEHWPEKPKKEVHLDEKNAKSKKARQAREVLEQVDDELLSQMVEEIAKL